jgi:hypothetical protein
LFTASSRTVDPDALNPDPDSDPDSAFQVSPDPDPVRIQSFDDQKLREKKTATGGAFGVQKRASSTSKN